MSRNWKIERRTFLRGAGALLPLPFLNLMEANARSGELHSSDPPLRFMTLFKPNGVHPPSWNVNGGKENDDLLEHRGAQTPKPRAVKGSLVCQVHTKAKRKKRERQASLEERILNALVEGEDYAKNK